MPSGKIEEANYFKAKHTIITQETLHLITFPPFQVNLRYVLLKENKSLYRASICSKILMNLNPTTIFTMICSMGSWEVKTVFSLNNLWFLTLK